MLKSAIDPIAQELEEWSNLYQHIKRLRVYVDMVISRLMTNNETQSRKPSLDSAIQSIVNNAKIDELKTLLTLIEFKAKQYEQYKTGG